MNNLPPGVSDNTYGAPWNDQSYEVVFQLFHEINGMTFQTENLMTEMLLQGPSKYDYEFLEDCAIEQISSDPEFETAFMDYGCDIKIIKING